MYALVYVYVYIQIFDVTFETSRFTRENSLGKRVASGYTRLSLSIQI